MVQPILLGVLVADLELDNAGRGLFVAEALDLAGKLPSERA